MFNITDGNNNVSRDKPVEHIDMVIGLHESASVPIGAAWAAWPAAR